MTRETEAPFPLISIAGPPRERGRQYGQQARACVERSLEIYLAAWDIRDDGARERLRTRAARFAEMIEAAYPELYEEIAGIAEGAGRDLLEIVALNARTEILYGRGAPADGCTGAALLRERTGGRVVIGQNWDWRPACRETAILLRIVPDRGPALLTFVEAGMLARSGMNDAGLGLCGNFLQSDRDFQNDGVPIPVIRRAILQSETLPTAVGHVLRAPRAFSSNHLLAHRDGEAIDLEGAPDDVFPVFAEDGLLVHSNNFRGANGRVRDTGLPRYPDSLFRDRRVRALLDQRAAPLGADDLKAALEDHFGFPDSVCRHRAPRVDGTEIATVASVVMDLEDGVLWLAPGPVCENAYRAYRPFAPEASAAALAPAPAAAS